MSRERPTEQGKIGTAGALSTLRLPAYGFVGVVAIVVAEVLVFIGVEPVATFFIPIVWTGYILLCDAVVLKVRGRSLLKSQPQELLLMAPLSILGWLVFEFHNLLLGSWEYVMLPEEMWARYLGYLWSFATIYPAIFETADLLGAFRALAESESQPWKVSRRFLGESIAAGALCAAVPLVYRSGFMIPSVWAAYVLLLDPVNYLLGTESLLADLARGRPGRLWCLMLSGLACGLLWEFWNFWAGTKWVYHVPYLPKLKLFEMPVLGFLGFPPFALECFAMYHFAMRVLRLTSPSASAAG